VEKISAEFFSPFLFKINMANYKKPKFYEDYLILYDECKSNIVTDKILMSEAVEKGYVEKAFNTNNIMDFDGDYYDFGINGYVDGILYYNIYEPTYFSELSDYENNNDIIKSVNFETDIINNIKDTENIVTNCNEINITYLKYRMKNKFKKLLLSDNNVKLYVAILLGDKNKIIQFLKDIDPRLNNNEAYHLAQKSGDKKIISLIRERIILLNWYEKLVYEYGLGPDVAHDIFYRKYL